MTRIDLVALICLIGAASASAAEPPAAGSKAPLSATAGPAVNVGADKASAAADAVAAEPKPPVAQPSAATPKPAAGNPKMSTAAAKSPAKAAPAASGAKSNDRLALDTTVVTGNRELPKVLYIVPWKKADIGELPGQPFNTLLDEVLTPVDRDVFRREVTYYGAISGSAAPQGNGSATGSTAPGPQPPGSEK